MRKDPGKDRTARGASKGRGLEERRRKGHECNNGIRKQGPKDQSYPRMRKTTDRTLRNSADQKIQKRAIELSIGLQERNNSTCWKIRPTPKRKNSVAAGER
jgi:hypothetical protein